MDLITTAIIAALAKVVGSAVSDAYEALKAAIVNRFGQDSDLTAAVESLEQEPDSKERQETLRKEVAAAKADKDEEVIKAAETVLNRVQALPQGQQVIQQTWYGSNNIVSGSGNVTVGNIGTT
jgi:hypothetical protein